MQSIEHELTTLNRSALAAVILATCLLLGNIYYAQPILYEIASSLRIGLDDSGLLVAFGQIGYIAGLLLIAPLGDTLDNRKLCVLMCLGAGASAGLATLGHAAPVLYVCIFFMGLFATATQILVVFVTSLAGSANAGKTLGIMACGIFLGIALSRPVSSFLTGILGWRYVYGFSSVALFILAALLYIFLPKQTYKGSKKTSYFKILGGMFSIAFHSKNFLRYTLLSFCAFMGFTMFWNSAPLYLAESMNCGQEFITFFTMAGLITPPVMLVIGRLLDKGWGQKITILALCLISLGWLIALLAPINVSIFFLIALLIDPCSNATTVTVQKTILSSVPMEKRGCVNSLNISLNFLGGTIGATVGPWLMSKLSWSCVAFLGLFITCILLAFAIFKETLINKK